MRAAIHTEKLGLDVTIGTCDVPGASSGLVVYTIKAQDDSDWQELGGESGVS